MLLKMTTVPSLSTSALVPFMFFASTKLILAATVYPGATLYWPSKEIMSTVVSLPDPEVCAFSLAK